MRRPTAAGQRCPVLALGALAAACLAAAPAPIVNAPQGPRCADSPNVPLADLTIPYRGLAPGLYAGGRTAPPEPHLAHGRQRGAQVRPLDAQGRPSPSGRIILLGIGMSNTAAQFGRFVQEAQKTAAVNPRVTIVNGALSGADAAMWATRDGPAWRHALSSIGGASSAAQVQVLWMKHAHLKTADFPEEIERFARNLQDAVSIATTVFPNLRIVYVSSRTRAGAPSRRGPGEPQAYETAFAVRRLIEWQQAGGGGADDRRPWVGWGPYLWANSVPRSDGFAWACADLQPDLLHPSESGSGKVAEQLLTFLMTAETSTPWFLKPAPQSGQGPSIAGVRVHRQGAGVPLTVRFDSEVASASDFYWGYGDGTSSRERSPRKVFHVPGAYDVRLTVADPAGRWAETVVRVQVP